MSRLANKVILITGSTGMVGRNSALALAKEGATVVLLAREKKQKIVEDLYDQIVAAGCPEPAILYMDFAKCSNDDYYALYKTLAAEFGKLDGIVHTAANLGNLTPLAHTNPEKWLLSINTTLNTPFYLTQAMLPLLNKAERGSVIFFDHAEVADGSQAYWGSYAVAKAGLNTLMKLFAGEFESQEKIQFNSIDPVCLNSAMRYSVSPSGNRDAKKVADVITHIIDLNDDARPFTTGQTFTL
ncbi:SDR family NAD(P)-dependent oxidoreductase [Wohlfahrtiimonas chitiniclastica]|uniref:SDR family NAD(P)-dependent oxidoreductase n=1 Tax=Wohlfahrtiimonas chitiniclastica TaxID=400946 RepID=UPI002157C3F5|nr:SDR family NAD(P)-dependent oxidoreductase [Wohlfahrtiimonas chitiniclastica]MDC7252855.1 YciK family oxidoreductase [Wohlfahrtiimonas chitiniclastica]